MHILQVIARPRRARCRCREEICQSFRSVMLCPCHAKPYHTPCKPYRANRTKSQATRCKGVLQTRTKLNAKTYSKPVSHSTMQRRTANPFQARCKTAFVIFCANPCYEYTLQNHTTYQANPSYTPCKPVPHIQTQTVPHTT